MGSMRLSDKCQSRVGYSDQRCKKNSRISGASPRKINPRQRRGRGLDSHSQYKFDKSIEGPSEQPSLSLFFERVVLVPGEMEVTLGINPGEEKYGRPLEHGHGYLCRLRRP